MAYDHIEIEKAAQEKWASQGLYTTDLSDTSKELYYLLVEFPYPSGDLHIGHWYAFAVTDIYARMLRARGKNVLFPIGFDAFGLPAENAAIKNGTDPRDWTYKNMERMREQLATMGASFDWSKEVVTCDPTYYQWTQWLFAKLFEHGLAEHREAAVKWCPKDQTVLANEQVQDGCCERCGTPVEEKRLTQWFLKITQYAERLLVGLDTLPWREEIKEAQRAWIGKSEGAYLDFALMESKLPPEIVFASNNQGKLKRMQNLIQAAGLAITLKTPKEAGIENFDVEEDGITLTENSEKKARALAALTDLPVLADDSGFFIDDEKIDPVAVKRNALAGIDEKTLTVEEVALRMQKYYADIAVKRGGRIDAQWRNALCFITADKFVMHEETIRPVTLTSESHGTVDPYMPLRGLYISKATNKYVLEQTDEEELLELKPIIDGFRKFFISTTSSIRVFTTRPDTIFGATYVVLAPEHPLVADFCNVGTSYVPTLQNANIVKAYVNTTAQKTERERSENKEKTGVKLEGVNAVNPATKEEIPIYVADYVLASYGTGAVMAVPAHDERDFEFAQKMQLPVRQVVAQQYIQTVEPGIYRPDEPILEKNGVIAIIKHWKDEKYLGLKWKEVEWGTFLTGGVDEGMTPEETVLKEIREETGFMHPKIVKKLGVVDGLFYHVPKQKNQLVHAHIFSIELSDNTREQISAEEESKHELVWLTAEELKAFLTPDTHQHSLRLLKNGITPYTGYGSLVDSGEFTGKNSEKSKSDIVAFVGGEMTTQYRLRDWLVSRQRYWGCPIPIVYDPEGNPHAIGAEHLPWLLPTDVDFTPTGKAPLASSNELQERVTKIFGEGWTPEYDTLDTFVDSSWYFLRYLDPKDSHDFSDAALMKKWLPINRYSGGSEHTTMHVLYARFFMKALYDLALVPVDEPFTERFNRGLIMGPDGQKMSKRWGNVINPDELVEKYGADAVRVYLAFIGPYNEPGSYPWGLEGVPSMRKFLERVVRLVERGQDVEEMTETVQRALARASTKIVEDGDRFKFNTAVAALMILLNELEAVPTVPTVALANFVIMLAPFAPHLAEHLWEKLNGEGSVHQQPWPTFDLSLLASSTVEITVQVNGKRRGAITLAVDASEADAVAEARKIPAVVTALTGNEPKRVVYVPDKILNLVV